VKVLFDRENKRLVCINQKATPDFWEKHWDNQDFSQTLLRGRDNRFILKTLQKYIPDGKGKIIYIIAVVSVIKFMLCFATAMM